MALAAVAGAVILRRRREAVFPVLAPILTVVLSVALFYATTRFRASAEGALCLLAAVAVEAAWRAVRRPRRPDKLDASGGRLEVGLGG
jgi:hypothetical protein